MLARVSSRKCMLYSPRTEPGATRPLYCCHTNIADGPKATQEISLDKYWPKYFLVWYET